MSWYAKKPIVALAPLADITDSPFCRVCREVAGNNFVIFREMVSSEALVRHKEKTLKMCEFDPIERPIVIQLFGANPENMAKAGRMVFDKFNPDGIDINMGCPVPKIAGKSLAGAALMRHHDLAIEIVQKIKALNLSTPISVKIRLGWSNPSDILEFAPKLEKAGVDVLTIHGRTKVQGYSGEADWEMISKAKKLLSIPVIANGDIRSDADIKNCLEVTDADGVMIGRAAWGNPWIFAGKTPSIDEIKEVVLLHARLHLERYGEKYGLTTFRKHLLAYFNDKKMRQLLIKVVSYNDLVDILKNI